MTETITSYDGDVVSHPRRVARPRTVAEVQHVVRAADEYPCPVRPMGSFHSLTPCVSSDGTILDMTGLNDVLRIDFENRTVTARAGAQLIDVAKRLREVGLQFHLNIEIGNATVGSVACCHTKDALDGTEFGQLGSYVTAVRWVDAQGNLREASDQNDPEEMRFLRSSYGLAGVLYEVTFRVRPLQPLHFTYRTVRAEDLTQGLVDALIRDNQALVCWTVGRRVVLQTRNELAGDRLRRPWLATARRLAWNKVGAYVGRGIQRWVPTAFLRGAAQDVWFAALRLAYRALAFSGGFSLYAPDKTVDYRRSRPSMRYAFTYWAFPRERWAENLKAYLAFSEEHYRRHGFRCNMPLGSYFIRRDRNAILSYTHDGDTISIDPIHAVSDRDRAGWQRFLHEFNEWSYRRRGTPLLNQSPFIRREHVAQAFGDRWEAFGAWVRRQDPAGRFLNLFFRDLLPAGPPGDAPPTL
jgi:FAD/FMN-containing dehydrogenase